MFSVEEYRALREAAGVLRRIDRGRLTLAGADRRTYLQGLLTNDIAALGPGSGCYAAFLTPQGRMIADMRVLELGDRLLLDLPAAVADPVRERLVQFVFAEDVEVADAAAAQAHIGVYGPRSGSVVAAALAALRAPDEPSPVPVELAAMVPFQNGRWDAGGTPAVVARNDDYGVPGFDIYVAADAAARVETALESAGAAAAGQAALEALRIEAGTPVFGADMTDDTIPLEAGIEERAISFSKGCYVGQEIIIRVLHRGHGRVARRLVGFTIGAGEAAPVAGDRVGVDGRDVGWLTSVTSSPALGRTIALGYVQRDFVEPGTAVTILGSGSPAPAVVSALPFIPPVRAVE